MIFVAPTGADNAAGTLAQPLATLSGARDAVRRLRRQGNTGPVEVVVQPGTYYLSEPLVLTPEDSGTATGPTTYRAAPGGGVVLSGGVPLTGWQKRDNGPWSAPAPAGVDCRLLRVGERWATRARYPKFDEKNPYAGGWLFTDAEPKSDAATQNPPSAPEKELFKKQLHYRPGDLPAIADVSEAEVHLSIAHGWVNLIMPLARQDEKERLLIFSGAHKQMEIFPGNRYYLANLREALNTPGEWFFDKKRGEVLYLPDIKGFPQVQAVVARLDCLIRFRGEPSQGRFVEQVRFEGFHCTDTTYTFAANLYSPRDACIEMDGARNCEVRQCEFSWCGGYALRLSGNSTLCLFVENRLHHMGQGGVITVGDNATQAHHCTIAANDMDHLGLIYRHVAGVYIITGSDHYVAHNRIVEVPRYAISFKTGGPDDQSHRNVAEFNEIRRTNLESDDTGAIETLGRDKQDSGNVIRYNLILDSVGMITTAEGKILTPHYCWGVYLDDYSSGTTIFGNIIARTVVGGVCINGGKNNVVENNIMVDGSERQLSILPMPPFTEGNRVVRNVIAYSRPEPELIYVFQAWKWDKPADDKNGVMLSAGEIAKECDNNLYWLAAANVATTTAKILGGKTYGEWTACGFDTHSVVADPKFVDPAQDDYRLAPDSPAFSLGFKRIPVELIGLNGWQQRGRPLKQGAEESI